MRLLQFLPFRRESLMFTTATTVALWMGWSLLQEMGLTQQLTWQAAQLRQQNAALQASNDDYRRDIASVSSGATAEEDARKGGYARPSEKVFVVSTPQATPPPAPAATASGNPLVDFLHWLTGSRS